MILKTIELDGRKYDYSVRISKRARYIRLQASISKNIELIVPHGVSIARAEEFLRSKKEWLRAKSEELKERAGRFRYFGKEYDVDQRRENGRKYHSFYIEGGTLKIISPAEDNSPINDILQSWLKKKAAEYIPQRTGFLASEFGYSFRQISIRDQKTRWGSCSQRKNLSFNYRLISMNPDIIDYVIVHELCHLVEMNHSKRFWDLLEKYIPEYKFYRRQLKRAA